MNNEDLLPIDIQCNKLVDWLIDRRHCSLRWQKAAEVKSKYLNDCLCFVEGICTPTI